MKLGVLFTGYGQQFVTMGKDLYDEVRLAQEHFEQASVVTGKNYVKLMFADSDKELAKIENGYGAIYLLQSAIYDILKEKGLCPEFIAGYGIGEYAATYAAGGYPFVDGLYLLQKYATLVKQEHEELDKYSILHIPRSITAQEFDNIASDIKKKDKNLQIISFNTQEDHFVVGLASSIDKLEELCSDIGIKKMKRYGYEMELRLPIIQKVIDQLKIYFHKITFHDLQTPLITNVDGTYITTSHGVEGAMLRRAVEPTLWNEVMDGFVDCDTLLIIGPGDQLIKWAEKIYPDKKIIQVLKLEDINEVVSVLEDIQEPCNKLEEGKTLQDADEENDDQDEDDDNQDEEE